MLACNCLELCLDKSNCLGVYGILELTTYRPKIQKQLIMSLSDCLLFLWMRKIKDISLHSLQLYFIHAQFVTITLEFIYRLQN
jgi:hypothetical protein